MECEVQNYPIRLVSRFEAVGTLPSKGMWKRRNDQLGFKTLDKNKRGEISNQQSCHPSNAQGLDMIDLYISKNGFSPLGVCCVLANGLYEVAPVLCANTCFPAAVLPYLWHQNITTNGVSHYGGKNKQLVI